MRKRRRRSQWESGTSGSTDMRTPRNIAMTALVPKSSPGPVAGCDCPAIAHSSWHPGSLCLSSIRSTSMRRESCEQPAKPHPAIRLAPLDAIQSNSTVLPITRSRAVSMDGIVTGTSRLDSVLCGGTLRPARGSRLRCKSRRPAGYGEARGGNARATVCGAQGAG